MRRWLGFAFLSLLVLFSFTSAWPQELSSQPASSARVCIAVVTNRTTKPLFVERMTERLARSLSGSKITTIVMDSATTTDRELHPTLNNAGELKSRECDALVLTQVADPQAHPTEARIPAISIGGKRPSVDASDPPGTASRDDLEVCFALFRPGSPKAVLDTSLLAQPSANVSDSLMQAMDQVANRVGHELKKK
ncbi:MAG: hypothetical protein WAQ52_03305 [Terriglobales bacterium]